MTVTGSARFFTALAADNSREFWSRHAGEYEREVRLPFLALVEAVGARLPDLAVPWRVYRPQRDVRFSADKSPYKTFVGAVAASPTGTGYFLQVSARGLLVAAGYPMLARDQLARYRSAVAGAGGSGLITAIRAAEEAGQPVTPGRWDPLTRAPRGFPADHPRAPWLRWKGVELPARVGIPEWADTDEAPDRILALWRRGAPVLDWLDAEVGPSTLSPEEAWGPRRRAG